VWASRLRGFWPRTAAPLSSWHETKTNSRGADIETRHINRLVNAAGYFVAKIFLAHTEAGDKCPRIRCGERRPS
jgi:hypothetical protein